MFANGDTRDIVIDLKDKIENISNALCPKLGEIKEGSLKLQYTNSENLQEQAVYTALYCISLGLIAYLLKKFSDHLLKKLDPTYHDKEAQCKLAREILKKIGLEDVKLNAYESCMACNIVDPKTLAGQDLCDIGGLDAVITDLKNNLILPFQYDVLFSMSSLIQPPKGVLLHGPPGCGKTLLAKAIARATGARFINLQVSSIFDKWYGESQKRAEAVFTLARKIQPSIIFIDEMDALLRKRDACDYEATALIKAQFMYHWDGLVTLLRDESCKVLVMAATNRPQDLDSAVLRRLPMKFEIKLPDLSARKRILQIMLKNEKIEDDVNLQELAELTENRSGSDLQELCRCAALRRVYEHIKVASSASVKDEMPDLRPISKGDFAWSLSKLIDGTL